MSIKLLYVSLISIVLASHAAPPAVQVWRLQDSPAPADFGIVFQAELAGGEGSTIGRPRASLTKGELVEDLGARVIVAPNHRWCLFEVGPGDPLVPGGDGKPDPVFVSGPGMLTVAFPLAPSEARHQVAATIPLQFYRDGAMSVGRRPLPIDKQRAMALSGTGDMLRVMARRVPIDARGGVRITADRLDTVAAPLGHVIGLWADSMRPRKARLVKCVGLASSPGRAIEDHSFDLGDGSREIEFWFYPWDKNGQMRAGATDLTFRFLLQERGRHRLVTSRLKVMLAPDGTSRIVSRYRRKPDLSPPQRARAQETWGRWRLVEAAQR